MPMWSGRFREPVNSQFANWQRSFEFDRRLLREELLASSAYARGLANAGFLTSEELSLVLQALEETGKRAAASKQFLDDDQAEDIHDFVEKKVVELIGDTGYKLHAGRSRNEQIATDLRLFVRSAIDQLVSDLARLASVFVDRAELAGQAAMPAYTHSQKAEPVLLAHWLLAYVEMFLRDADRLADCRKRVDLCPLGSGAVAGATLPLDRAAVAADLKFRAATANSIDATGDRDFALELTNSLSILAIHMSRWAEEMILFSTREFGFLRLPEAYSTGSSAMPQKVNPDLLELIRAKAGRVIGAATALMVVTKGLPLAYDKDLQELQQPMFDATETILAILPLAAEFMRSVEFNQAAMSQSAQTDFTSAFAAATYIARRGVPFRIAHERVGKLIRMCIDEQCDLSQLSLEKLQSVEPAIAPDFYEHLTLNEVLATHDVPGGTAPARVRQAIADTRQRVDAITEKVHAHA